MAIQPAVQPGDILKTIARIFSPRVAITVALVCATLLVVGDQIPSLQTIAQQYSWMIWLLLLLSGFYSLTFPIQWLGAWGRRELAQYRFKRHVIARLHSLTIKEKHVLQEHVEKENGVVGWSVNRVEVSALAVSGLLGLIQQNGSVGQFKLADGPRKYLLENKQLIETPNDPRPTSRPNEWMI